MYSEFFRLRIILFFFQKLLGVDQEYLGALMTVSTKVTRAETIRRHYTKQKASASRDALAKAIYDRIFRWIVNRINQLLAPTIEELEGEVEIGILDIFGFEKFEENNFEQLCINLANEQLQYFFNEVCEQKYTVTRVLPYFQAKGDALDGGGMGRVGGRENYLSG